MTREEKQLLLKDLCARLPYGVYVQVYEPKTEHYLNDSLTEGILGGYLKDNMCQDYSIDEIYEFIDEGAIVKPYLCPMSSMTEEERKEYWEFVEHRKIIYDDGGYDGARNILRLDIPNRLSNFLDWLDYKMFDYRGLIEKGLALEAKEGMYKTE